MTGRGASYSVIDFTTSSFVAQSAKKSTNSKGQKWRALREMGMRAVGVGYTVARAHWATTCSNLGVGDSSRQLARTHRDTDHARSRSLDSRRAPLSSPS